MIIPFYIYIIGFLSSIILNIVLQFFFLKKKRIDQINHRSSHNTLATKTGGIALYGTIFLITFWFYINENQIFDFSLLIPLGIIFLIGVYDDLYDADFKLKFLIQIIVGKLLIDYGFIINDFHGFLWISDLPNFFAQIFTILAFLVIVNSINFIDGVDGLAISIVVFSIICFSLFNLDKSILILNLIIMSAILPLFYFNFRKNKKIFLGDAGSLMLGSIIAMNVFNVINSNSTYNNYNPVYFSMLVLSYPLIDFFRIIFKRIQEKKSPFFADKNHIHHLILSKSNSHFKTTSIIILFYLILTLTYFIL